MTERARVEITVWTGRDWRPHTITVPVDSHLMRELTEPMELSDSPFSLLLASPKFGVHPFEAMGETLQLRKRTFVMRKDFAEEISKALTQALVDYFGDGDKTNGYRKDQL